VLQVGRQSGETEIMSLHTDPDCTGRFVMRLIYENVKITLCNVCEKVVFVDDLEYAIAENARGALLRKLSDEGVVFLRRSLAPKIPRSNRLKHD
jgi:hypothetical protein